MDEIRLFLLKNLCNDQTYEMSPFNYDEEYFIVGNQFLLKFIFLTNLNLKLIYLFVFWKKIFFNDHVLDESKKESSLEKS